MPDRLIGQVDCWACEGTGWVVQIQHPTEGRKVLLKTPDGLSDFLVAAEGGDFQEVLLILRLKSQLSKCQITECPCPKCGGKGWETRVYERQ